MLSGHLILLKINFGINQKFTKYLKESCVLDFDPHFSFKYFLKIASVKGISQIESVAVLDPSGMKGLSLPVLRLLSSKAQGNKEFKNISKPCHVGIHSIAITQYSQMSTHVPGF